MVIWMRGFQTISSQKVTQRHVIAVRWVTFICDNGVIVLFFLTYLAQVKPTYSEIADKVTKAAYDAQWEIDGYLEQASGIESMRCPRNAPFICYKNSVGMWNLVQASCNSWTCNRCGLLRAKEEYGRMVQGAKTISEQGHALYFHTYTCRGMDMPLEEADRNYMLWTNRLLTTLRKDATKRGEYWCYVQVTERQKRGHAHSHCISTYCPSDAIPYAKGEELPNGRKAKHDCLWSEYYRARNVDAGLGAECDLSLIRSPIAVAVYTAKYLFKDAQVTEFQKGWRRIRYSRNYPKLPTIEGKEAFAVVKHKDWLKIENLGVLVRTKDTWIQELAYAHLVTNVVAVKDQR